MSAETNLEKIKQAAKLFLDLPYKRGEILLIHPYYVDNIMGITDENGDTQFIDITKSEEDLRRARNAFAKTIDNAKTVNEIFLDMRMAYHLTFFDMIKTFLSPKDYGEILADIWCHTENPNGDVNVPPSESAKLFEKAEKRYMMDEEEMERYNSLPDKFKVYRGVGAGRVRNGLSWTDNVDKAKWFAERFNDWGAGSGYVLVGMAEKKDVLAYLNKRDEDELVISPSKIKNVRRWHDKEARSLS